MSWVLASFLVLGLALTVGFGWYERSHPSARVLALVATLAALAALGRIAFAPLPSVKPTTDIVLLTGYVLGGISPVGHRSRLDVVLDESVTTLERVYVSAGRRGLQLSMAPADLLAVTGARVAPVGRPG